MVGFTHPTGCGLPGFSLESVVGWVQQRETHQIYLYIRQWWVSPTLPALQSDNKTPKKRQGLNGSALSTYSLMPIGYCSWITVYVDALQERVEPRYSRPEVAPTVKNIAVNLNCQRPRRELENKSAPFAHARHKGSRSQ